MRDYCRAVDLIIHKGRAGEIYNVGTGNEMRNIDRDCTADDILPVMQKGEVSV